VSNIKSVFSLVSDEDYREFVIKSLHKRIFYEGTREWLVLNREDLLAVYELDFEPIHQQLRCLYSNRPRHLPHDPQVLLRSLLLMTVFGVTSITAWTKRLRSEPLLAIFAGTTIDHAPAVGTYYEFFKRLENGNFEPKCRHRVLDSEQRQARKVDCLRKPWIRPEGKPDNSEHGEVMRNLVKEIISAEDQPLPNDLETRLNLLLRDVAVKPSAAKGLISELDKLAVAADGSVLKSYCDHDGKPVCDCHNQGIYKCDHARRYSDPDSDWGWDNRVKDTVFGYRFAQVVALDTPHNLPLYLNIDPGSTYEPKMIVRAIDRMTKMGMIIKEGSFDALYDCYAFYGYLAHNGSDYAIPYNQPPAKCLALGEQGMLFDDKGRPLCPGGLPMIRQMVDKQGRQVYSCPVKRGTHIDGKAVRVVRLDECPLGALCDPKSKLGPLVHVAKDIDLRIHPTVPRGSEKYKELCNARTTCERSNSMKKEGLLMKFTKMRVMSYAHIRLTLVSILEHSLVWARKKLENIDIKTTEPLALFA